MYKEHLRRSLLILEIIVRLAILVILAFPPPLDALLVVLGLLWALFMMIGDVVIAITILLTGAVGVDITVLFGIRLLPCTSLLSGVDRCACLYFLI